jgi:phosphate transport system permease protein
MLHRNHAQFVAFALLRGAATVVVVPVVAVLALLAINGGPALSLHFLTAVPTGDLTRGGILSPILGTLYLVGTTILIALPLGLFSAIYLSEYAKPGPMIRLIRLAIVNLAGVPSIVYGLFGYGVFCLLLQLKECILAGSLTLALLILPVIIVAAEEALIAVPQSFREASLALGATKWQTTRRVVLPNALPGILTGAILGISRAAGETAPIMFTVAALYMPRLPQSLFDKAMALPYHLYNISTQVPDAPPTIQWGTALTLLLIAVGMNIIASVIRVRYRKQRAW